jgi:predicted RNase H-like HicB family nuclease
VAHPFIAIIHRDEAGFGVSFPDAPGCFAAARSLDAVKREAASALRSHMDVSAEEGLSVPVARSPEAVLSDPQVRADMRDAFAALEIQPLARSGKVKRINLTVDEFALGRIDRAAKRMGVTRSAFMTEAALERAAEDVGF